MRPGILTFEVTIFCSQRKSQSCIVHLLLQLRSKQNFTKQKDSPSSCYAHISCLDISELNFHWDI